MVREVSGKGSPRRRRRGRAWCGLALALALGAGVSTAGCRRPVTGARSAAFRRDFDDGPAGLQLGPGWYRPEPIWGSGSRQRRGVAYTDRIAEIYFAVPPFPHPELAALVLPLIYPKAPPQAVTAVLNQHEIGTFPVPADWSELRIPLPASALVSPVNALVLRFARVARPADVGLGKDVRTLAALFDSMAVVPRGEPLEGGEAPAAPVAATSSPIAPRRPLAGRPDVFLYLIDTLRADSVGVDGSALPTTPRIDAFSRDAVVFDQARSAASWTLPAVFSILSGRYPFHHGVHLPGDRLPRSNGAWLPVLLERAGYETLGISQWLLGGDGFGISRGFESFFLNIYSNAKMPSADARWFLAENLRRPRRPERPLFCFLHTVDPHAEYEPRGEDRRFADARPGKLAPELYNPQIFLARGLGKDPADVAHLRALYEGEVHAADREFGRFVDLLKAQGLYDESLIVLVADHGEEFGEHGAFDHGRTLFDELLRVPLLVKFPRSMGIAPRRLTVPASNLDVAPTVLAAIGRGSGIGSGFGSGFDGESLVEAARGGRNTAAPRTLYSETKVEPSLESQGVDLEAVILGGLKCIGDPAGKDQFGKPVAAVRAYDLRADPGERSPLPAGGREQARCAAELARFAARARAEAPAPFRLPLSDEATARLRALGYVR
ncbi:MAG TPA: sulfatase [Thermoanaerobaculia bacterium]